MGRSARGDLAGRSWRVLMLCLIILIDSLVYTALVVVRVT